MHLTMRLFGVGGLAFFSAVPAMGQGPKYASSNFPMMERVTSVAPRESTTAPTHISVTFDDAPLSNAVRTIARRGQLQIMFSPTLLPNIRVSYSASDVTPETALAAVLRGTGVRVERLPSGVIKLMKGEGTTSAQGIIVGTVRDAASKRPLAGVVVRIDDATRVVTNERGVFRAVNVAVGQHVVVVKSVGYSQQTQRVQLDDEKTVQIVIELTAQTNQLSEVVVTGTVAAMERRAIANSITVITAKDLETRGITRIDQLFRGSVPGVFVQNSGNAFVGGQRQVFTRGISNLPSNGANGLTPSNPMKTYIDGVEMANPSYLATIDPSSIERIEIVTGPQASTIYGSDAIAGVMQIFMKHGGTSGLRPSVQLDAEYVSTRYSDYQYNSPGARGDIAVRGGTNAFSYTGGFHSTRLGQYDPAHWETQIGSDIGTRAKIRWVTGDVSYREERYITHAGGGVQGVNFSAQQALAYQGVLRFNADPPRPYNQYSHSRTFGSTLTIAPAPWAQWETTYGVDEFSTGFDQKKPVYYFPPDSGYLLQKTTNPKSTVSSNMTLHGALFSSRIVPTFTFGGDRRRMSTTNYSFNSPIKDSVVPAQKSALAPNSGYFAQLVTGVYDKLFVTAGIRREHNRNYGSDKPFNYAPKWGIAYNQDIGSVTAKIRTSYGRSTRPLTFNPSITRLTTSTNYPPGTVSSFGNPNVNPELQRGGESAIELYVGQRGSFTLTKFNQVVDGLIASVIVDSVASLTVGSDGFPTYLYQYQYQNTTRLRNQGWESEAKYVLGPVQFRGTYSLTVSRILSLYPQYRCTSNCFVAGGSVTGAPSHMGAFGATFTNRQTTVDIGLNYIGQTLAFVGLPEYQLISSARLKNEQVRQDIPSVFLGPLQGYWTGDINVSRNITQHVVGRLRMVNAGNSSRNDYQPSHEVPGREMAVGITLRGEPYSISNDAKSVSRNCPR